MEARVEVWENEKLKWEHEPAGRVFPRNFEFSQTSTSVSITRGNTRGGGGGGGDVFYAFYKNNQYRKFNVEIVFFVKA